MAGTTVTPTRMMLKQLKGRLKTARRGHKLMKDKRDELMRQFMDVVKLNKQLRTRVEEGLTGATRVNIIKPVYTELPSTTVAEFSGKLTVSHKVKD